MSRLKVACEKAKRDLSSTTQTLIEIDSLYEGIGYSTKFFRAKFEELNSEFFEKCIEHVKSCLIDGNMHKNNVYDIVIVGGSTRIPKIQQMLREFFDGKPPCMSIKADEAVAYGAAVLAANLSGNGNKAVKDVVLLDVTPLSLGMRVIGGEMSVLIPRNTPIPTFKEDVFVTTADNQVTMPIRVFQGESSKVEDNIFLDEFVLHGLKPAPKGKEEVKVSFNMNADGILNVSAESISTGHRRSIAIARSGNISTDDVLKMLQKAGL